MRPFDPALLRAVPETRAPVALLAVVGAVTGAVSITQAVTLAVVVTRVASGGPVVAPLTLLVGLLLARGALAALTEVVSRWAGRRVSAAVRLTVLRSWLRRPVERRPRPEVAVTRATEGVAALEPYVSGFLPALVTAAVVPALAVLTLLVVDPWSALIVVLTLPLLPVFAALIGRFTQAQTERRWAATAALAGHFLDVVKGLPTLVAYGRARAQVDVVRRVGQRHRRATVATLRTAFLSTAALELLATISVAMVAVAVGLRLAYGGMELVVALTAILIAPEAYWPVRRVGAEFHNAADGAAVLADLKAEGLLGDDAGTPVEAGATVALSNVTYAHEGRDRTLAGVTLSSPTTPGLTALTGPSGAGKTTVLELLAGLRVPGAGMVTAPPAHLASQRPVLLPGTVRDALALVGEVGDAAMVAALEQVGLWEALATREGLGTVLGEDGFGLSAGQRGRLALARALLSDAPLVLLDEPTANIAPESVPALHAVIGRLATTRRVIVVTHDPVLAAQADDHWEIEPLPRRLPGATTDPAATPGSVGADRTARPGEHTSPVEAPAHTSPEVVPAPRDGAPPNRRGSALHGSAATPAATAAPSFAGGESPTPTGWRSSQHTRLAGACVLGGLSVSAGVALTATSGWLIVQASTRPVILTLMVAIVGVRAFGIARPVLRYAERVLSHDVALGELAERRPQLFADLIPLTPARLGRRSRGEVLTGVVRDLDDVVDATVRYVVPAASAVIATVLGVVLVTWHLPPAGAAVAVGGALVAGLGVLLHRLELGPAPLVEQALSDVRGLAGAAAAANAGTDADRDPQAQRAGSPPSLVEQASSEERGRGASKPDLAERQRGQGASDAVVTARGELQRRTSAVTTQLTGIQAARGLGADPAPVLTPVTEAETALDHADRRLTTLRAAGIAACWVVLAVTVAGVTILLSRSGFSGPYAALVALVPIALADTWVGVPDLVGAGARGRAAASRVAGLVSQDPAVAGRGHSPAPSAPDLTLDAVTARWSSDPTIPLDLPTTYLALPQGSRVELVGPNGAGKSTALAVLARHLDPADGRYAVGTTDARALDLDQLRSRIAVVDDEPHTFAGTVRANLLLAAADRDPDDAELVAALESVDLGHWFDTLPAGLDTPVTGVSGGERARLALARALISQRPVVLLDEPTAHLDDATAQRALDGLLAAADDTTSCLLVSHRPLGDDRWERRSLHPATPTHRSQSEPTALMAGRH